MKPRLTHEQHDAMGLRLGAIQNELLRLSVQLGNAYPRQGPESIPQKKLETAHRAVNEARRALENRLFDEHPATAHTNIYSPWNR